MSQVYLPTKKCIVCGKRGKVYVDEEAVQKLRDGGPGTYIQDAMPDLSAGLREQIISGTHPKCWDVLMTETDYRSE
jgi:hypothetical protein